MTDTRAAFDPAELPRWDRDILGPRRPGGTYLSHYSGQVYRVEAVHVGPAARARIGWSDIAIEAVDLAGSARGVTRVHCTRWDDRDQIIT